VLRVTRLCVASYQIEKSMGDASRRWMEHEQELKRVQSGFDDRLEEERVSARLSDTLLAPTGPTQVDICPSVCQAGWRRKEAKLKQQLHEMEQAVNEAKVGNLVLTRTMSALKEDVRHRQYQPPMYSTQQAYSFYCYLSSMQKSSARRGWSRRSPSM
jgi:hypothetical protein